MKVNRFRKTTVKNPETGGILTLKDELSSEQGGSCVSYSVSESTALIVKLMNLSEELIYQQFQQEILAFSRMRDEKPSITFKQSSSNRYDGFSNIVQVHGAFRAILKDVEMGVIILENCPKGSLDSITKRLPAFALKEIQIMRIIRDILAGVQYLHFRPNPLIHRNLTMENVLLGEDNYYKITNFSNVTTHRNFSISSDEISGLEMEIKKHTTEGYRAPEQIHLYSGQPINEKVDIFAVGVILYILCFSSKPFESMITTLNAEVEIPDFPKYSSSVSVILQRMLTRESQNRPSSADALNYILSTWPDLKISQSKTGLLDMDIFNKPAGSEKEVRPTIFNKFKKMITLKVQNRRTKGWIMASLEEDEQGPKQKYMRLLIIKAWQNVSKIEKFYDYFNLFLSNGNIQSTIIALKSLILLHNYVKKGPPEAMSSVGKKVSAVNVLKRIIETWQNVDPTDVSKDKKRSLFTIKLVNQYAQRLKEKMNICVSFSSLIEGNFSLKPFFDNMNKNFKPLTPKLIEDLLKYMQSLLTFASEILSQNVLIDIQMALMIQLVDEMYCLLSAQTHLLVAFIMSTNYLSKNIDRTKLYTKIKDFKALYVRNFEAVRQFFRKCQTALAVSSSTKDFIPNLDLKVLEYLENVPYMQDLQNEFNLFEFLNYKKSIFGIKIPLSYGATIQANSRALLAEIDAVPKKPATTQKLILQLDDQMTTSNSNSNSNSQDTKEKNYDFQNQFKRQQQLQKHSNQQQMQSKANRQKQGDQNLLSDEETEDTQLDGGQLLHLPAAGIKGKHNIANQMVSNSLVETAQVIQMRQPPSAVPAVKKPFQKGEYLIDIDEDFDDIGNDDDDNYDNNGDPEGGSHAKKDKLANTRLILGDYSDSDEESMMNLNNQNYNDILYQDDEGENLHIDFAHQSLNDNVQAETQSAAAAGLPSNLDKFKNMNFVDFNDISNIQLQHNHSNLNLVGGNGTAAPSPATGINRTNHQQQQVQSQQFNNSFAAMSSTQQNNHNNHDVFRDFENFENFGLTNTKANGFQGTNNNNGNNQSHFDVFNFQFDQKNSGSNTTTNNRTVLLQPPSLLSKQSAPSLQGASTQVQGFSPQQQQNQTGAQQQQQKQQFTSSSFAPVANSNNPFDFNWNSNTTNFKANNNNNNATGNSQQSNAQKPLIKFEFKDTNTNGTASNRPPSQSMNQVTFTQPRPAGQQQQQQYQLQQFNINNGNANTSADNRVNVHGMNNNQFNDFFNPQIQQQQIPQPINNNNQQRQQGGQSMQGSQIKQKNRNNNNTNAEEFEPSDMLENHKGIQFQNPGQIKPNDLNQLNQMPAQNSVNNIKTANNQVMGSVYSSTYSSNNENLIELKNFIINRVKHDPKELILEFRSLVFGKKIGSGHSGKVFSGTYNNVEVAIKEMEVNTLNVRNQKEFQREIETLVKLSPQINLVSLIGVAQKKDNFYVVTELCNGGTVFDILHRKKDIPVAWLHRVKMSKDIAKGMLYLHSLEPPIIHRDLKSLNLLLDVPFLEDSFNYNIKIADFGLARTESKEEMTQVLGTFHWMAPEVFDNKQYTIKADVYSYAIVLWEFITRKTPYQKMSTVDIMRNVCEGKRPNVSADFIPSDCPPMLFELMKDCWAQEPNLRPDFKQVLDRLDYIEQDLYSNWQKQKKAQSSSSAMSSMQPPLTQQQLHLQQLQNNPNRPPILQPYSQLQYQPPISKNL